jgi:hypothetical protein
MKAILLSALLLTTASATANAAIVCDAQTRFGTQVQVTIAEDHSAHVTVTDSDGNTGLDEDFPRTANVWDGHMTGLITAPGLSFKYENQYGCIRNVLITTNVRGGGIGFIDTVRVPVCRGGTTSDHVCGIR